MSAPPLPIGVVGVGALGRHHARHLAALPEAPAGRRLRHRRRARRRRSPRELGTAAFRRSRRAARRGRGRDGRGADAGARRGRAAGARTRRAGADGEAAGRDARRGRRADRARRGAAALQLQVGHIERYNRAVRAAEPYLDGPRYIESQRLAPFQPRGTDVAVVLDLMIHDLDLVLHLTGGAEATEVRASGLSVLSPHLDIANARVEFANGAVALATASRVSRERVRRLRLFQPNGYLSLDLASGGGEFMRVRPDWQPGTGAAARRRGRADRARGAGGRRAGARAAELRARGAGRAGGRGQRARRAGRRSRWRSGWPTRCGRTPLAGAGRTDDRARRRPASSSPPASRRAISTARASSGRCGPAIPDATIEALGGPRMAQAGATLRYPMEGLAAFGLVEVVTKLGAALPAAAGAPGRLPGRTLRSRDPDRLSRLSPAGRRGGAAGRHQGAVLHRAAALGLAARSGRAASRRRWTGSRWCCRSSSRSSAGSGSGATTWGTRSSTARRGRRGEAPRARSSASTRGARCSGSFPAAGRRRSAGSGRRSATPRSGCSARGAATGCWSRRPPAATIPTPGRSRSCAAIRCLVFAAADAALAKSGTTTLEAALADTPMVVAYKVHPLTWRMFQRLRTVRWVSLVNLVAEREVVPELLQDRADGDGAGGGARGRCWTRTTRAPSRSARVSRWCASGSVRRAPRTRVVALADELLAA